MQSSSIQERTNITFFGCTNAGKSSLVNAFTNQNLSIVSPLSGTTTDPVRKTMELPEIGPVLIIDTAGIGDDSHLGELRLSKTQEMLNKTDIALLVIDSQKGKQHQDTQLITLFQNHQIPYLIVWNKCDLVSQKKDLPENEICVSALTRQDIDKLRLKVATLVGKKHNSRQNKHLIIDKLTPNDTVILVMPMDNAAPMGRLILPQQQTLRELLDFHCTVLCTQETELEQTLNKLKEKPKLVITDSKVFNKIKDIVPDDVFLTSFSILFARFKGDLATLIKGANKISQLRSGDHVLISEACTHHRQCGDIGSVKMPQWLQNTTQVDLRFNFTSGGEFPQDLSPYQLIVHCGGCMLNEVEMKARIAQCNNQEKAIVNYGLAIAYMHGILKRSLAIFPEIACLLESK